MEKKKPVYRDGHGAEVDPVEYVGTLWINNTLPSIAFDAVAQFILVNALDYFEDLKQYGRVEWTDKDGAALARPYDDVDMGYADLMRLPVDGFMDRGLWDSFIMCGMLHDRLKEMLAPGDVMETSIRASLRLSLSASAESYVLSATWMKRRNKEVSNG